MQGRELIGGSPEEELHTACKQLSMMMFLWDVCEFVVVVWLPCDKCHNKGGQLAVLISIYPMGQTIA